MNLRTKLLKTVVTKRAACNELGDPSRTAILARGQSPKIRDTNVGIGGGGTAGRPTSHA